MNDIGYVIVVVMILMILFSHKLFRSFKWYRYISCNIMGWHSYPSFDYTTHDGCSQHAKCRWCNKEGMIDSQGNLF